MTNRCTLLLRVLASIVAVCGISAARAETATVAVAANFAGPLEALQKIFERSGEHRLTIVSGSTGQLYAQITNGAPFDVLLSADVEHVDRLVADGAALRDPRFTYAIGKLALFTRDAAKFKPLDMKTLERSDYR